MPESSAASENPDWRRISESAADDPGLQPSEKEVVLSFARDEEKIHVHAEIGSVVARLLRHPHFEASLVRVDSEESAGVWKSAQQWRESDGPVRAVTGWVPVGLLKVGSSPRSRNIPSQIVSDHRPEESDA